MNIENVIIKNGVVVMSEIDFRDLIEENQNKDYINLKLKNLIDTHNNGKWLSINEYAKKYGICRATVYNWIRNDKILFQRIGSRFRVKG